MFISTGMAKLILVGTKVHSILTLPPCKVSSSGYPWRQPRKPRLITRGQLLQLQGIWNILTNDPAKKFFKQKQYQSFLAPYDALMM